MMKKGLFRIINDFSEKHKKLSEIIRFVIVGGIATVIDYIVMGITLYLFNPSLYPHFYNVWIGKTGEPSTIATIVGTGLGFCVSLIANYILSVIFVYEEKGNSKTKKGMLLFAVLSVVGLLINMLGMWVGFDLCKINEWVTKIIMTLVVLFYNYITRKLFIFKKTETANSGDVFSSEVISSESEDVSKDSTDN